MRPGWLRASLAPGKETGVTAKNSCPLKAKPEVGSTDVHVDNKVAYRAPEHTGPCEQIGRAMEAVEKG